GRLYRYLGFQATVYLSPFLRDKQSFWASALYSLSGQRQRDPPKWRLCLHLVDRLLPGLLMESIRMTQNETTGFREFMACTACARKNVYSVFLTAEQNDALPNTQD
ncbi:unnamed protein product, partial [Ixodes persulcatus]